MEVMACPGGCINGGGQLKPPVKTEDAEVYMRIWEESGVMEAGPVEGVCKVGEQRVDKEGRERVLA